MQEFIPILKTLQNAEFDGLRVVGEYWTPPEPRDVPRTIEFDGTGLPFALLRLLLWPTPEAELRKLLKAAECRELLQRTRSKHWPLPEHINFIAADGRGLYVHAVMRDGCRSLRICAGTPVVGEARLEDAIEMGEWIDVANGGTHTFIKTRAAGLALLDSIDAKPKMEVSENDGRQWVVDDELVPTYFANKATLSRVVKGTNWARKPTEAERQTRPDLVRKKLVYDLYAIQHYVNMRD